MADLPLNDRRLAVEIRNLALRLIDTSVRERLTQHRYGLVSGTPDTVARTVAVRLYGLPEPSPGFHYGTGLAPRDGDHVRVYIDPRGDKWIDDILGRDLVSEIVDAVTPPLVQPDRAFGAIARIPVLVDGAGPVRIDTVVPLGNTFVFSETPPEKSLILVASTTRAAPHPAVPAGFTELWFHDHAGHGVTVGYKIAGPAETNAYVMGGGLEVGALYAPGATIGEDSPQEDVTGTVIDGGGPIVAAVDSEIWAFVLNTYFFGGLAFPDGDGETTVENANWTANPPGLWAAYKSAPAGNSTAVTGTFGVPIIWSGYSVAIAGSAGGILFESAPEAVDRDDVTYHVLSPAGTDQAEAVRLDLRAAYRVIRARIVLACATAGAKTYTLRGATQGDFSDEVTLASMTFTAAGSFVPNTLTPTWPSTTPYRYWRIVGPAETRRLMTVELYEQTAGEVPVTDPTTGLGAGIDAALAAVLSAALAAIITDHGGLAGLGDDDHPQYTTAAELAAYAQPLDADLTAIAALATTSFGRSVLTQASAAALRVLAGLVIGADVEAHDSDLTTIAGLAPANDDVIQRKAGAWTNRTIAQLSADLGITGSYQPLDSDLTAIAALATTPFGRGLLTLADAAALRTTAGLVIGTDVQAFDAELAALASLTSAADGLPYFTGAGTAALATMSSFIRTLLDDPDAATARATLGIITGAAPTDLGAWVPVMDGLGNVVTDSGTGAAIMTFIYF